MVDDSNKRSMKCVVCFLVKEVNGLSFSKKQLKSIDAIKIMIKNNGGTVCEDLDEVSRFLEGGE